MFRVSLGHGLQSTTISCRLTAIMEKPRAPCMHLNLAVLSISFVMFALIVP